RLIHTRDAKLRIFFFEIAGKPMRKLPRLLVSYRRVEWHVELQAFGPRHLNKGFQLATVQPSLQMKCDLSAGEDVGRRTGIEIEDDGPGLLELRRGVQKRMQFEAGDIGAPDKRREI